MNQGDLVKPTHSCSGQPGSIRCKVAIVIEDKDDVSQDYQLARALDLLRGVSLYSGQLGKQTN